MIDVRDTLNLNAATVNVSGKGMRGGVGRQRQTGNAGLAPTDFRTLSTQNPNGEKGEGVAGTPGLWRRRERLPERRFRTRRTR